jgi:hypothetical protein
MTSRRVDSMDLRPVRRWLATCLLAGLVFPAAGRELAAQSLLASSGLGVRADALDARSRALGNPGIGLSGARILSTDPAAAARLTAPSIAATFQPTTSTLSDGRAAGHARFPTIALSYPFRGNAVSVQFASHLDQEWGVLHQHTINVGGTPVNVQDQFTSGGSVGQVQLGWARPVMESFAIGVNLGTYVGTVERALIRQLDPADVGPDVEPFVTRGRWRASGNTVGLGLTADPSSLVRVSTSVTWSQDLEFEAVGGNVTGGGSYAMPLEFRVGGMATLVSGLALAFGTTYANWSDAAADLQGVQVRDATWSYGAGLEWTRGSFRDRPMPIRFGARHVDLPFHHDGEPASERTFSGGVGLHLVELEDQPFARIEVGLERGDRTSGALSETFWRSTVSIRLAGS